MSHVTMSNFFALRGGEGLRLWSEKRSAPREMHVGELSLLGKVESWVYLRILPRGFEPTQMVGCNTKAPNG